MENSTKILQQFQNELEMQKTLAEAAICITTFFDKKMGWRARLDNQNQHNLSQQARNNPRVLTFPVSSNYHLFFQCPSPPDDGERAIAKLAAGLVSGIFPGLLNENGATEMLATTSGLISGEIGLDQLFTRLREGFASAFPGISVQVLTLEAVDNELNLLAVLGNNAPLKPPRLTDFQPILTELMESDAIVHVHERHQLANSAQPTRYVIPVHIGSTIEGALTVYTDMGKGVTANELSLLSALANQIGVAISIGKLRAHLGRQNNQLETIYRITESARTLKPLAPTLQEVLQQVNAAFEAPTSYIAVFDEGSEQISFPVYMQNGELVEQASLRINDPANLTAWVIRNDKPYATTDWQIADRPVLGISGPAPDHSILCFPMHVQGNVVGAIGMQSPNVGAYSESDYYLLAALAGHVGIIVRNAQLHEKTNRQLAELTTLYQANATMTSDLDQEAVMENVVKSMSRALGDPCVALILWDSNHRALLMRAIEAGGSSLDYDTGKEIAKQPLVRLLYETQQSTVLMVSSDLADEEKSLLDLAGFKSLHLSPLSWLNQHLGMVLVGDLEQERQFSDSEQRLIRNLASQAAVSLEHARLFSQSQRRLEELELFQHIALQITSRLDLNVVLETISESALRLMDINNLHIYLYDSVEEKFDLGMALWRDGRRDPAVDLPRKNGLTASVAKTGKPIIINDAQSHALYQSKGSAKWGVAAIAGFPLKHEDRVIGVFTVTFLKSHSFGDDELLLLKLLADQASVAIENARVFNILHRQVDVMSSLVNMAQQVTGNLSVDSVLNTTVHMMQQLLDARASTVTLVDDDELVVEAAAGTKPEFVKVRLSMDEGGSALAVRERRAIYVRDTQMDPEFHFFDPSVRSMVAVPLISRGHVLGTLTVDQEEPDAFTDADVQFLTIAASQVSVALSNARYAEELEKRAEQLAFAIEELRQNEQLKDEMLQNLSHELRTPLTFVKGYVDLLLDDGMGELNDAQREALEIVTDRANVITRIISDVVVPQHIDASNLSLQELHIVDLLQTAVSGHQLTLQTQGFSMVFNRPEGSPKVRGDQERIVQAIDNLINNAVKFSPKGGTITVGLAVRKDEVEIVVADQGIGVEKEKQNRIFDRFFQADGSTEREYGGIGIGLAIVKQIVEAHGGRIWVESEQGQGSSFYITLPKIPEAFAQPAA